MKFLFNKGETDLILPVWIQDSSSSVGAGLGSLDENSSITGGYLKRGDTGVALTVDENVTTEGTYQAPSAAGKVRIGTPANMLTGMYELHFHNDLFTTADYVTISLSGATNMAPLLMEIQFTDPSPVIIPAGYVGDYKLEETVHFAFSTTAALSLPGGAGNGIRVFKDDGDTQLTTAQATLDAVDGETNLFQVSIVLGAANYDVDSDYQVVLSGATIGGATVTAIVATFSIQNRYQAPVHRLVSK